MPGWREIAENAEKYQQYPRVTRQKPPETAKNQTGTLKLPPGNRLFNSLLYDLDALFADGLRGYRQTRAPVVPRRVGIFLIRRLLHLASGMSA